jgi:shikimate kinase
LETNVLAELAAYTRLAIATGGGIVLKQDNWSYLHHGVIVWLDVSLETLQSRLQEDTTRPLLQETDLTTKLQTLLQQRQSLYAQADVHILCDRDAFPEQVVEQVLEGIQRVIKPTVTPPAANDIQINVSLN